MGVMREPRLRRRRIVPDTPLGAGASRRHIPCAAVWAHTAGRLPVTGAGAGEGSFAGVFARLTIRYFVL